MNRSLLRLALLAAVMLLLAACGSPSGGGDIPENGIGAISFAYQEFDWRPGAQKMMIFVTDACQHSDVTFDAVFGAQENFEHWAPPATDDLKATLRGNAVVHVIAPDLNCSGDYVNMRSSPAWKASAAPSSTGTKLSST